MAEFTVPKHGEICWQELTTTDLNAAKTFYKELLGWNMEQSKMTNIEYSEIHLDGNAVGGMMQITKDWGENWEQIPSGWMTYMAVDDVDSTVEKIKENKGEICMPAFDMPGVGRMAVAKDPSGVSFSIISFKSE